MKKLFFILQVQFFFILAILFLFRPAGAHNDPNAGTMTYSGGAFPDLDLSGNALQQQRVITGRVTGTDGQPMVGVTVIVQGTTIGTVTDVDGNFTLEVPVDAQRLVISFVGMVPRVVDIADTLNVVLEEDRIGIDEVVAVGYMTQRKLELTGSVSIVNVDDIVDVPSASPLRTLQGRVAGLFIETSGDPAGRHRTNIIRGLNTLGDNSPLFVIDGVSTKNASQMMALDPHQIESIQVLKDASASSVYGSRASNGVIIVTTKGGRDRFNVDFNTSITSQHHLRRIDVLNTEDYGRALWQASINDGSDPGAHRARYSYEWHYDAIGKAVLDRVIPVEWIAGDPAGRMRSADTDWQDEFYRTGLVSANNLTVSGRTDHASVLFSLGYHYSEGVIMI